MPYCETLLLIMHMSQGKYIAWETVMLALCMTEFVLHHFPTPRIGAFHCTGEKNMRVCLINMRQADVALRTPCPRELGNKKMRLKVPYEE